ncbi:MAG: ABC-2 family transporter protein, partial [Deltaproteobacteria bacterium]|nr:ABC-2 family transporter protein [Deltaproteobacteria bacterium]
MRGAWSYLLMRAKVRLAYRGDLALSVLGDLLVAMVGLAAVAVLYHHVSHIRGYDLWEVLTSWGLAQATLGVFWTAFGGLNTLNRQYILGGDLDRVLLRPLDPYLQVMLDHLDPGALLLTVLGLGVFTWGWLGGGAHGGVSHLVLLPVFLLCGALLIAGLLTAAAALGFWFHHQGTAVGLLSQFSGFAHYPLEVLPRPWAILVTTALPFAFTGFLPATFYMDRPEWAPLVVLQPLIGISLFAAGYGFWRVSLRRYES